MMSEIENKNSVKTKEKKIKLYTVVLKIVSRKSSVVREDLRMWMGVCYSLDEAIENCAKKFLSDMKLDIQSILSYKLFMYDLFEAEEVFEMISSHPQDINSLIGINYIEKNELMKILIDYGNLNLIKKFKKYLTENDIKLIRDNIKNKKNK